MAKAIDSEGRPLLKETRHNILIGTPGAATDAVLALCAVLGHDHKDVARIVITPSRVTVTEFVDKESIK